MGKKILSPLNLSIREYLLKNLFIRISCNIVSKSKPKNYKIKINLMSKTMTTTKQSLI